jgi:hypothetical protein
MANIARVALTVVIGCGLGIEAARPQDASSVTVEVGECVNLPSPEERFACYERQVEVARTAPATAPRAPGPQPDGATVAAPGNDATDSQEFVATVTDLRQTVPNSYVITLDNGQVWRQTYAEWYPLRPGLKVRLRPSRWGGTFRLSADQHQGYIQVKRVR